MIDKMPRCYDADGVQVVVSSNLTAPTSRSIAGGSPAAGDFLLRRQKKVTQEERPGLGLAQRGAGRGACCRKKHFKSGRHCCRFSHQIPLTASRQPPGLASSLGGSQGIPKSKLPKTILTSTPIINHSRMPVFCRLAYQPLNDQGHKAAR